MLHILGRAVCAAKRKGSCGKGSKWKSSEPFTRGISPGGPTACLMITLFLKGRLKWKVKRVFGTSSLLVQKLVKTTFLPVHTGLRYFRTSPWYNIWPGPVTAPHPQGKENVQNLKIWPNFGTKIQGDAGHPLIRENTCCQFLCTDTCRFA